MGCGRLLLVTLGFFRFPFFFFSFFSRFSSVFLVVVGRVLRSTHVAIRSFGLLREGFGGIFLVTQIACMHGFLRFWVEWAVGSRYSKVHGFCVCIFVICFFRGGGSMEVCVL